MASAFARIESHEELCALRYAGIITTMRWILGGMGGMIVSLFGWMAYQLYTLEPLRVAAMLATQKGH